MANVDDPGGILNNVIDTGNYLILIAVSNHIKNMLLFNRRSECDN